MIRELELRFRGFFYLSSDIVVVGNKITFRNASFRLLNSFLLAIQFKTHIFTFFDQCRRTFLSVACLFAPG